MIRFRSLLIALFSIGMICGGAYSQEVADAKWNVQVEMQIVALPEDLAVPLVPDFLDEKKIEAAYAKLQMLIASGKAKLVGWPILTTMSGQRAVIESIEEMRFPSEFKQPGVEVAKPPAGKEAEKAEPKPAASTFDATPAAFETRNAGVTLEIEPVVSADGHSISVNLVPQHVRLHTYKKSTLELPRDGTKLVVEQPEFHTSKVTTSLTLQNGERKFLGAYKVADPAGHMEFFILKVGAKRVP